MAELTLGDFDPNRNCSEKDIYGAVSAVNSFHDSHCEARSVQKGLSFGDALQRFSYTTMSDASPYDREFSFDVANLDVPCLTRNGKKQSPALATFCRRSGILDDSNGAFKLSRLGSAVFNRIITPQEFVFILLTKQGVYVDGQYRDKFLVSIARYLLNGGSFSGNQVQAKAEVVTIVSRYLRIGTISNEVRTDLLLNAMRMAGLLRLSADGQRLVPSEIGGKILSDILRNKAKYSATPVDSDANYAYMRDPRSGVFEALDDSNKPLYYGYYPGLKKLFDEADKHLPSRSDFLKAALELFRQARQANWLTQGREVNARLREYFDPLTEQSLGAMTEDKIGELFLGVKDATGQHVDLVTMWAGRNGNGWSNIDPAGDAQKVQKIRDYLVRLKHDTALASTFWAGNAADSLSGFGSSVVTELLMKFHPDEVLMYAKEGCGTLKRLGLIEFDAPNADNAKRAAEFKLVQAAGTIILAKMRAMNIDKFIKSDGTGDGTAADYMTVNEFLCFVKEKFQEIKNMAKQMQQKTVTQNRTAGNNDWSKLPNDNPDSLMYRLAASLLTRPFAILAGASGTGKSRMVKKLACMTCYDDDLKPDADKSLGNYQMIQVKPSWHDSSELLGYRSMLNPDAAVVDYKSTDFVRFVLKAHAYPNTPFFVCLDEMNLAPVEQYFAEFLSACESVEKKEITGGNGQVTESFYVTNPLIPPTEYNDDIENIGLEYPLDQKVKDRLNKFGLYIPRNLFVVGTVNMDDTTCSFSRKVLDRAMTIEMNEVKFDTLKDPEELIVTGTNGLLMKEDQIKAFVERKDFDKETLDPDFLALLEMIQEIVKPTPFAVGYRFALETSMYREALKVVNAEKMVVDKIDPNTNQPEIDPATNQPKKVDVSGVYALDHMILTKILPRITGNKADREKLTEALADYFMDKLKDHKLSADALEGMLLRADDNGGYLSFWP